MVLRRDSACPRNEFGNSLSDAGRHIPETVTVHLGLRAHLLSARGGLFISWHFATIEPYRRADGVNTIVRGSDRSKSASTSFGMSAPNPLQVNSYGARVSVQVV